MHHGCAPYIFEMLDLLPAPLNIYAAYDAISFIIVRQLNKFTFAGDEWCPSKLFRPLLWSLERVEVTPTAVLVCTEFCLDENVKWNEGHVGR
jgi:hypothetical protein